MPGVARIARRCHCSRPAPRPVGARDVDHGKRRRAPVEPGVGRHVSRHDRLLVPCSSHRRPRIVDCPYVLRSLLWLCSAAAACPEIWSAGRRTTMGEATRPRRTRRAAMAPRWTRMPAAMPVARRHLPTAADSARTWRAMTRTAAAATTSAPAGPRARPGSVCARAAARTARARASMPRRTTITAATVEPSARAEPSVPTACAAASPGQPTAADSVSTRRPTARTAASAASSARRGRPARKAPARPTAPRRRVAPRAWTRRRTTTTAAVAAQRVPAE